MKITKCVINGKNGWVCLYKSGGRYHRKYFWVKKDAEIFVREIERSESANEKIFFSLSKKQIEDVMSALAILPSEKTLTESVKKAWQFESAFDLHELADKYHEIKKNKYEAGRLSKSEYVHIKGRVADFKKHFKNFSNISPTALRDYLLNKGGTKTISLWRGTISEMLEFCVSKGAIPNNPVRAIHTDELIKPEPEKTIGILSVEQAKDFMEYVEKHYPQYCRFYALAMFAGIRVAEVPRLKDEYFLYKEKKIIFPAQIGKIKKSWTLEDLPDNLWAWLKKYKDAPIVRPSCDTRSSLGKRFALPENFARHSFATYHLSLYFDPARTSRITRNSEQMLRDHYWGALVDKKTAQAYFAIMPKK